MTSISHQLLQHAYRYAMSLTNEQDSARDIVHTAYTKLLEKMQAPQGTIIDNHKSYLLRSVRNTFIDQKRFQQRWQMVPEEASEHTVDISIDTLEHTHIQQDLLHRLWPSFSAAERELLHLWAVEEYTMQEISELTDTPRGTLLSRIHRIRQKVIDNHPTQEARL